MFLFRFKFVQKMNESVHLLAFLLCILVFSSNGTLSPKNRGKKLTKENKTEGRSIVKLGPQTLSVFEKDLVSETIRVQDVLKNYQQFFEEPDQYRFDGLVLGYVTPWNNHGYDIAKIFGNKFTHISPVWLQIQRKSQNAYEITGGHDIDKKWIANVRNAGRQRKTKIVPRVLFEQWVGDDYVKLLSSDEEIKQLTSKLIKFAHKHQLDGYVLEAWTSMAYFVKSQPGAIVRVWKKILKSFQKEDLDIILAVHPKGKSDLFKKEHFDSLYDFVTGFSLMTYDFSNPQNAGPNAPFPWIEDSIKFLTTDSEKRKKILMGLNFYGNKYGEQEGQAIVGNQLIEILQRYGDDKEFVWDPASYEHFFQYTDEENKEHVIAYPTLYSIQKRIELAKDLKTGISIWEIGQGLDYFYDLL